MTWKTKSVLNYIVSGLFIVLVVVHIRDGKDVLRVCCDVIPALWFGIIATVYMIKHHKNN